MKTMTTTMMGLLVGGLVLGLGACSSSGADGSTGGAAVNNAAGASAGGASAGDGGATAAGGSDGGAPAIVELQESCDPLSPCGGDVEGTWTYASGCVTLEDLGIDTEDVQQQCPDATITASASYTGTVAFTGGAVARAGGYTAEVIIGLPASCKLGSCGATQALIASTDPSLAAIQCSDAADGGCDCTLEDEGTDGWSASSYTVEDNTITLDDGRTFDYCVAGSTLTYQETGADPQEVGTFVLSK